MYQKSTNNSLQESGDLGLGYGLKPGSLLTPNNYANSSLRISTDLYKYYEDLLNSKHENILLSYEKEKSSEKLVSANGVKKNAKAEALISLKMKISGLNDNQLSLDEAKEEIQQLKIELELLKSQMSSKQQAIKILQQQLKLAYQDKQCFADKSQNQQSQLIKEINQLQFDYEKEQHLMSNTKETWQSRISRIIQENADLTKLIENQRNEISKLCSEKKMLAKDLDHFRCLLDDDKYNDGDILILNSQSKKAINNSCPCSQNDINVCPCSIKFSTLEKENISLKNKLKKKCKELMELSYTSDLFTSIFEVQLTKCQNKISQHMHLVNYNDKESSFTRKLKSAFSCTGGDNYLHIPSNTSSQFYPDILQNNSNSIWDESFWLSLFEMINNMSEVLSHQKIIKNIK